MRCIFRTIVRTEGARAFYLSFPTTVAMNMPYGCVMVATNESSRKFILSKMKKGTAVEGSQFYTHSQSQRMSASMLAGAVAGAVAALMTTPLDVVKTRLQTQNLVSKTLGNSVPLPVPCPAFTQTKRHIASATSASSATCPAGVKGPCVGKSGVSSSVGADFVVAQRYRSMGQTFRAVVTEEGALSLLRGAVPRILVHAPSVAISWTAYEFAKGLLAGNK
jgi:solute carrier family 25 iron transporter 28/37